MAGKLIFKFLALTVVFVLLNLIYAHTLFKDDLKDKYPESLLIKDTQNSTDIYYFGESSNVTYAPRDSIYTSISDLTGLFFPPLKITTINKYATHGGIYKFWLKEITGSNKLPKAIVITLNLRSFDAAWIYSKLETPLREGLVLRGPCPPLLNRFLLSLQAFDNKSEQQREKEMLNDWKTKELLFPFDFKYRTVADWDFAMSQGSYVKPDGSWDADKIALACHYIKGYAFNLDENNPRIIDFDEIAAWGRKNNIHLYLNLMAENIQYADSLVGKELVFLMKQNRDFLVKRYQGICTVVDNLEAVRGKYFIDQNWTTEHYFLEGRMIVARNLADSLKNQFYKAYKKAY
jgi:hypothetical protein